MKGLKSTAMMKAALKCERISKLEDIDREIKDTQKRMRRFKESGDLKRLIGKA